MSLPEHIQKLFDPHPEYRLVQNDDAWEVEYDEGIWPLAHPLDIELAAYRTNWNKNAYKYFKKAHDMLWPSTLNKWHYWTERRFRAHCELLPFKKVISMAGGANIAKSYDCAKILDLFWLANPTKRTVLVASTALSDLDRRIWGFVKRLHTEINAFDLPGNLYYSKPPQIILSKKDTIHGIFAVPLLKGKGTKTTSNVIGHHPDEGFLAIIDEGTEISPGFLDAIANWEKAQTFQLIILGNSMSAFDPHGILSTPKLGWDAINPDFDTEWETKRGICLYFDCFQSPAIHDPDPVKRLALSEFLPTEKSIEKDKETYGENSPSFWRFARGYWPPEDISTTVLTALLLDKHKAKERVHWSGDEKLIRLLSIDPSFSYGGDDCILRIADLSKDTRGKWVMDFGGDKYIFKLALDAKSKTPIDYQIVHQAMKICADYNIPPANVAIDVNGTGTGLGSIVEATWSKEIYKVDSVGPATELFVDSEETITARDLYDRRVTELWFMMQKFVIADQVRGLDDKTCEQLCTRIYNWKGKKICIETKKDYKLRLGKADNRYKSPDEADSACYILDLARTRFGFIPNLQIPAVEPEKSGLRKYFDSQYSVDGLPSDSTIESLPEAEFIHPNDWEDGFLSDEL